MAANPQLDWQWHTFTSLKAFELHSLLQLRQAVFILEQDCLYPDIDGIDPQCQHLLGLDQQHHVQAYLRLVPPHLKYAEPALGRIVVSPQLRQQHIGRELVQRGIKRCQQDYPKQGIRISAQQHLANFYQQCGFQDSGKAYLEDGIPHIEMFYAIE